MTAYYNEFDPFAAQWLRNLIAAGHIAPGDVDTRSIVEVSPDDLRGYSQCHFFAGIGGWSLALRLAGWDDSRLVWTGSCPCQPFSAAGKRKGEADERHLWPEFRRLIAGCRPAIVFGEQVASKDGRQWLAGVRADLEALGHAVGAADLCSASVGAPHIRQRLWWVAHADGGHTGNGHLQPGGQHGLEPQDGGAVCGVGVSTEGRRGPRRTGEAVPGGRPCREVERPGTASGRMGDADCGGSSPRGQAATSDRYGSAAVADGGTGFWSAFAWLPCTDGKARRVEPGTFPLAHGVPGRVGRLRAYGNAINPWVAKEFILAYEAAA